MFWPTPTPPRKAAADRAAARHRTYLTIFLPNTPEGAARAAPCTECGQPPGAVRRLHQL